MKLTLTKEQKEAKRKKEAEEAEIERRKEARRKPEAYIRWHSLALIAFGRAAGKTQSLEPSIGGSRSPAMPNAGDLMERNEIAGGVLGWLAEMDADAESINAQMHAAIIAATAPELDRLIGRMERAEWLLKVKWDKSSHRQLKASEANIHGREDHERTVIMGYRGIHTKIAARELRTTVGAVRWIRRKHGLSIRGERMYPCTVGVRNTHSTCSVCADVNSYSDDYMEQDAA